MVGVRDFRRGVLLGNGKQNMDCIGERQEEDMELERLHENEQVITFVTFSTIFYQ